jgi:PST family polysaccharide transporter
VVRSVALPYFSRVGDAGRGLASVCAFAWAGALPAGAALAVLSAPVVTVLYGDRWLASAPVLAALGLYGGLRVLFDVFAGYLYARGHSRPVLWVQIVTILAVVGAMIPAALWWGIVGAGWAHLAVGLAVILPSYLVVLRRAGVDLGAVARALVRPTLAVLPAVAVAIGVRFWIADPLSALLVGGAAFALAYLALAGPWLLGLVRTLRSGSQAEQERAERSAAAA